MLNWGVVLLRWSVPLILIFSSLALQLGFRNFIDGRIFVFIYPVMVIGAMVGPFSAGILSVILASVGAWFLFVIPYYSFAIANSSDMLTIKLFLINGLMANIASELVRRSFISKNFEKKAALYDVALSSASDFYYIFGLDQRIIYANKPLLNFWRKSLSQVVGKSFKELNYPDELSRLYESKLSEVIRTGSSVSGESTYINLVARLRYYEFALVPNFDENGNLKSISGTARDVTEKKLAEDRIRQSEERFRILIDGVKDYSIFLLNNEGIVSSWNDGAERISQYSAAEIIGKHFSVFYQESEIKAKLPETEIETATNTGRFEDEGWRVKKDGTLFWASVILTALRNHDGALLGFSKITRDLTERKKAEDALQEANRLLEKRVQERTAELNIALNVRDEFLSIASHELKTPITSLKMQIQLTQRAVDPATGRMPPADKLAKVLAVQDRQASRLAMLVDELLDVSKIQAGKLEFNYEEFDLAEMTRDLAERFDVEFKNVGSKLSINVQNTLKISADRFRIEQVLVNLLTNAIKYGDSKAVEILVHQKGEIAKIEVIDHGLGIAKENLSKIFNRFERAISHHNISGLGLGLYISKEIIDAHAGTIKVESMPKEGSHFTVELPLRAVKNKEKYAYRQ